LRAHKPLKDDYLHPGNFHSSAAVTFFIRKALKLYLYCWQGRVRPFYSF